MTCHHSRMFMMSLKRPNLSRHLSSCNFCGFCDFDVIRPYFSSGRGMECKYIISCLMTTMQSFHIYGFKTMAVVCDGASANLKAIKYLTTEGSGAYGINEDPEVEDPHHVKAWMLNHWTNHFFIPCPSHQIITVAIFIHLKCYCDQIIDIHFFTFSCTI